MILVHYILVEERANKNFHRMLSDSCSLQKHISKCLIHVCPNSE